MILVPEGTKNFFDKREIKLDDRNDFRRIYGKDRIYYCSCNMKVPYKLAADNRFYPCNREAKHEPDCTESDEYRKSVKRITARREYEDGTYGFTVIDRVKRGGENGRDFHMKNGKCHQDTVKALSFEGFVEMLFLDSYASMKRSTKPDRKDIYKIFYAKLCSTRINWNGTEYLFKSDDCPFKMFYGRLDYIPKKQEKENPNTLKKFNCYTLNINGRDITVSEEDLKNAVERYKERFGGILELPLLCVIRRMKSKYRIESSYFSDTRIMFFPLSEKGCICQNTYERRLVNQIEKLEENQLQWYFYKPFEYGYGAFGSGYLEDGIIISRGKQKKLCLEFNGWKNEDDLAEKKRKLNSFVDNGRYELMTFSLSEGDHINAEELIEKIKKL